MSSIERFHCIQDSQLGPNGVHYTEVPLYVEETGTPYKVSTHSGLHMWSKLAYWKDYLEAKVTANPKGTSQSLVYIFVGCCYSQLCSHSNWQYPTLFQIFRNVWCWVNVTYTVTASWPLVCQSNYCGSLSPSMTRQPWSHLILLSLVCNNNTVFKPNTFVHVKQ